MKKNSWYVISLIVVAVLFVACSKTDDDGTGNSNTTVQSKQMYFDGKTLTSRTDGLKAQNANGIYAIHDDVNNNEDLLTISFLDLKSNQLKTKVMTIRADVHQLTVDATGDLLISGTIFATVNVASGQIFVMRIDENLNVIWQKKYNDYSLPYSDSYYYNSVSNIENNKLVVCNRQRMFIVNATTGEFIKGITDSSTYHWLRNLALSDGFMAFGRFGADFVIAKYDWDGTLLYTKKALDSRPDTLLKCGIPIKTTSNKIIVPYNTYQYNPEGRGGYLVLDLDGNMVDNWNHVFFTRDLYEKEVAIRGGFEIEEIAPNKFFVKGSANYFTDVEGKLLNQNYHQGAVFALKDGGFLQFQTGGLWAAYSSYVGVFKYSQDNICAKVPTVKLSNFLYNNNLISYSFTEIKNIVTTNFTLSATDTNVPTQTLSVITTTNVDFDYCNLGTIK